MRHATHLPPDTNGALARRLRRIEGQVRGLQKMVDEERYCADVLVQIASVQEALRGVGRMLLQNHLTHCVTDAIRSGKAEEAERVLKLIQSLEPAVVRAIHVKDGQRVQAGQLLIELDPTGASADKASVQEQLRAAESEAQRGQALLAALAQSQTSPTTPRIAGAAAEVQALVMAGGQVAPGSSPNPARRHNDGQRKVNVRSALIKTQD